MSITLGKPSGVRFGATLYQGQYNTSSNADPGTLMRNEAVRRKSEGLANRLGRPDKADYFYAKSATSGVLDVYVVDGPQFEVFRNLKDTVKKLALLRDDIATKFGDKAPGVGHARGVIENASKQVEEALHKVLIHNDVEPEPTKK